MPCMVLMWSTACPVLQVSDALEAEQALFAKLKREMTASADASARLVSNGSIIVTFQG